MEWKTCLVEGVAQLSCFEVIFARFIQLAAALAGMILLVMLMWGGFMWMTSSGDPKKTEAARGAITSALLGLVLIVGSYVILNLIAQFTGLTNLTTFKIVTF